jgi:hypothetical protein
VITDIHSEDRLVQATFAYHLEKVLGWDSVYAHNEETFGPAGTLGRASDRDVVLVRDLRAAMDRLNSEERFRDVGRWASRCGGCVQESRSPVPGGNRVRNVVDRL